MISENSHILVSTSLLERHFCEEKWSECGVGKNQADICWPHVHTMRVVSEYIKVLDIMSGEGWMDTCESYHSPPPEHSGDQT